MENENPTKAEITQVFRRLRSVPANKSCFDCGAKNPTWSSATYGVFICIDCSGIHRSLGVHLTFVRSTQLDTTWSWQQVRQMQLGGNANATSFFRQHNCDTTDTQVKYNSRAAQLYRDKLRNEAAKALRVHGTKLFIDTVQDRERSASQGNDENDNTGEVDFFEAEASSFSVNHPQQPLPQSVKLAGSEKSSSANSTNGGAPNVEAALATSASAAAQIQATRKPTIGQRKTQPKKGGLGAKKTGGLGAQKVKKDFAEIEREAELADLGRQKAVEEEKVVEKNKEEDEAKAAASMRLAYQDLSLEQKKTEEKIRTVDPKKAKQVERLGMGVAKKGGFSHSAITEISTIDQEEPSAGSSSSSKMSSFNRKSNFEDEFEFLGGNSDSDWKTGNNNNRIDKEPSNSSWEKEFEVMKTTSKISGNSKSDADNWLNSFDDQPPKKGNSERMKRPETLSTNTTSSSGSYDMSKYSSAKAISSDMLFGNESNSGPDANLSRFQGSASISSAEYFGRQETPAAGRGLQTPDMDDVKESVRQGVTKVAGRLSGLASGALSSLQDKYGY